MVNLIIDTPDAHKWVEDCRRKYAAIQSYASIKPAVIWTDARDAEGRLLVSLDPENLALSINFSPLPILNGHDQGYPLGDVLEAATFRSNNGTSFVVAIFAMYEGRHNSWQDFDVGIFEGQFEGAPECQEPFMLGFRFSLREIDNSFFYDELEKFSEVVRFSPLFNNSADALNELIRIAVPYGVVVWNPFVTSFASEFGKDAYTKAHDFISAILKKCLRLNKPLVQLEALHRDCEVLFLLRGKDISYHYMAHERWSQAGSQSFALIDGLLVRGLTPTKIVYEFDAKALKWYPSYARLNDGRLITDNPALIAVEQLPSGISLGLQLDSSE